MKRILTAILCAGILAVTAVGCSYNDALYKDGDVYKRQVGECKKIRKR